MCDLFLFMAESNVANEANDTILDACKKKGNLMCKVTWNLNLWHCFSGSVKTTSKLIVVNLTSC